MAKIKKKYKLSEIIPRLSEDSLNVASELIKDQLFLEAQLEALRKEILEKGPTEEYQYGSKPTGAMETFLKIQKQYSVNLRILIDLMPKTDKTAAASDLLDWVNNH